MVSDHEACTGCGVCALSCPVGCITMKESSEGFFYPEVDKGKCVGCGLCEEKCHLNHKVRFEEGKAYAVISRNKDELQSSSSGGVFSVLARNILDSGGLVVGCELHDGNPRHVIIRKPADLHRLRGSKYVESDLAPVFQELAEEAGSGRKILFSGTGCQIGAVKKLLGEIGENDSIIYVEIPCHGVPSRSLFQRHNEFIERKYGDKLTDIRFRCKDNASWNTSYRFAYTFRSGRTATVPAYKDAYYMHFIKGSIMRPSCYQCAYAGTRRIGDITLGDYWGVENHHPELDASKGVSAVLVNSPAGERLFNECSEELTVIPTKTQYIQERVHALKAPISRPAERDGIYALIEEIGYAAWNRQYSHSKLRRAEGVKAVVKRILPDKLRVKAATMYHGKSGRD